MRKLIECNVGFLLFILLAACGPGGAGNSEQPSNNTTSAENGGGVSLPGLADTQEYAGGASGITLRYPSDWTLLEESANALTLGSHATLATGQIPDGPYVIYLLSVAGRGMAGLGEEPSAADLTDYLTGRFAEFGLTAESIVVAPEETKVGEKPASTGTVQLDDGTGREVVNIFTVFVDNDRLVTTIAIVPADSEADYRPTLTALDASVAIEEPDLALVEGVETEADLDRAHDPDLVYPDGDLPPIGGIHNPFWQNCGIYDEPVVISQAIHSLEHGAVWIAYDPALAGDQVEHLRELSRGQPYVLLSPYPGLRSPVVLSAWGVRLELDSAIDERVGSFIERYQAGPQTPEPGASCQNGVGEPNES